MMVRMRRMSHLLLVPALLLATSCASLGRPQPPSGTRAVYTTGPMGRLGDCVADGIIAGAAVGTVYGMFATDRGDTRLASMLLWGLIGTGLGTIPGMGYWAVHEIRRDHALRNERPEMTTTPGPRAQSAILRKRPCRGMIPFTSGPTEPAAARAATLPWVREP